MPDYKVYEILKELNDTNKRSWKKKRELGPREGQEVKTQLQYFLYLRLAESRSQQKH